MAVAVMNHPSSFRCATTGHVRAYGLFMANPWLAKGKSVPLRYRVHARAGDTSAK